MRLCYLLIKANNNKKIQSNKQHFDQDDDISGIFHVQHFVQFISFFCTVFNSVIFAKCCSIFAVAVFVTSPSDGCKVAFCRQFPIRLYKQPKATIVGARQTSP